MDATSTIVGLAIIALIILPFAVARIKRNNKNKDILARLKQYATGMGFEISEFEIFRNFIIAIDTKNKICFFKKEDSMEYQLVLLGLVTNHEVIKSTRLVNVGNETNEFIEGIALSFIEAGKQKTFELFSSQSNFHFTDELRIAKKWDEQIKKYN